MQPLLSKRLLFVALMLAFLLPHPGSCQSTNLMSNIPAYSIREPSYLIVAPRVIRPAEKIQISCSIMNKQWENILVKALIFTHEQEIASGVSEFLANQPGNIAITMPNNIRQGQYFLRVEGKLPTGEMKFSDVKPIIFQQKAVSILIQLDRPTYRAESIRRHFFPQFFRGAFLPKRLAENS